MEDMKRCVSQIGELLEKRPEVPIDVVINDYNWVYPITPFDFCIFNFILDGNRGLVSKCIGLEKVFDDLSYTYVGL